MAAFYDPDANRAAIAAEWRKLGWSDVAIAGMLGRANRESSFNMAIRNPNDAGPGKDSVGLFQWNRSRLANLYKFANQQGMKWSDPRLQARYVHHEITQGDEKKTFERLQAARTVKDAANAAMLYTRPKGTILKGGKLSPTTGLHYKETLASANKFAKELGVDPTKLSSQQMEAKDLTQSMSNYLPTGPSLEARDERAAMRNTVDSAIVAGENVVNPAAVTTAVQTATAPSMPADVGNLLSGFLPKQKAAPVVPSVAELSQMFGPKIRWAEL